MAESDTTEIAPEVASAARKYWSAEGYTEGGVIREVDYAAQSGGLDPMFAGIKIVDTDKIGRASCRERVFKDV